MREPSLLVPYPGPDASGDTFDVYVYLRPETNGVLTESVLMKTITGNPVWKDGVKLVYLANYPGDFIRTRHLVEHHYRLKILFARRGGSAFTPGMRAEFSEKFGVDFPEDRVLGAFDAMKKLGVGEEELFSYRVGEPDMLISLGQNIKRRDDFWIVNYDIPAVLHRNTFETDIAVMVFRVGINWKAFTRLVDEMSSHLVEAGVLSDQTPPSRAFHHSRSPWEQLLDGIDYLWGVDVSDGGAEDDISFGAYMMGRGYSRKSLKEVIRKPLVEYRVGGAASSSRSPGTIREGNIFELSAGRTYPEAEEILRRVVRPLDIPAAV